MVIASKIQTGFAYLAVLFLVAAASISLAVTSQQIDLRLKREKEQDWLFAGLQYQRAIASYYQQAPDGIKVLPKTLDELTQDKRYVKLKHHLRKIYADPVNANRNWQLILNEDKQIMGVTSESNQAILIKNQVSRALGLDDASINTYAQVQFRFKIQKQLPLQDEDFKPDEVNDTNNNSDSMVDSTQTNNQPDVSGGE